MERIIKAFRNSVSAFRHLAGSETAFRQELGILVLSLPAGWLLAGSLRHFLVLIGSVLLVLLVEVLNTGIEAACDAVTAEINDHIRIAKDCGSLAVLIAILIALAVWGMAVAEFLTGAPL